MSGSKRGFRAQRAPVEQERARRRNVRDRAALLAEKRYLERQ